MNYNIHEAINYRSHRKGLISDISLNFKFKAYQRMKKAHPIYPLQVNENPANTYPTYYPNQYGKRHSKYPKTRYLTDKNLV